MKELKELVQIISKNRHKKIEIFNPEGERTSKKSAFYKFYRILTDKNEINTDEAASRLLYKKPTNAAYRNFKLRFRNRLLNTFLFLDITKQNLPVYSKVYYTCSRYEYCTRILLMYGARKTAISIAQKALNMSLKYELTEFNVYFSKVLKWHSALHGNNKQYNYYHSLYEKYINLQIEEEKARDYFDKLNVHYSKFSSHKNELLLQVQQDVITLEDVLTKHSSLDLLLVYYRLKGRVLQMAGKYAESIKCWEEMENLLNDNKQICRPALITDSSLNKLSNFIQLSNYSAGLVCVEQCKKYTRPYTNNWYIMMENYFLLALRCKDAELAKMIMEEAGAFDEAQNLPRQFQEKWRLLHAYYLFFLVEGHHASEFRLNKFQNEMYILNQDKKGFNLSLIMLEVLYCLRTEDYIKLINRIDSLKTYSLRYLKENVNYRGRVFIKMLVAMGECNFDMVKVNARTGFLFKRLASSFQDINNRPETMEIIPIEDFWSQVTDLLKNKKQEDILAILYSTNVSLTVE